jgi:diguanylate cyclase (GGDEF)-like protein/PAS domain S-box-containing protein
VLGALLSLAPGPLWLRTGLLDLVQVLVISTAGTAALSRSRREVGRTRAGWALVAAGMGTVGIGNLLGTAMALGFHRLDPVSWIDGVTGLGLLVFASGLVVLCSGPPLTSRWLSMVDTTMASSACLFVVWGTLLTPPPGSDLSPRERILYAYLGGMALILVLALLFAARWRGDGRTMTLLGCGLGAEVAMLVALAIASAQGTTIAMDDPRVGMVFPLGTALLGAAAAQRPSQQATWAPIRRQWTLALGLPVASVAVVGVTAGGLSVAGRPWDVPSTVLAAAVGVLLFVRQGLTLLENRRLTLGLEVLVAARTAELAESRRHFRDLVQHSTDVIATVSRSGVVTYCSPAVSATLGYEVDEVVGRHVRELIHPLDARNVPAVESDLGSAARATSLACRVRHADGSWRSIEATVGRSSMVNEEQAYVVNVRDVTDRKLLEERLRHQAFHDPLTGLANRALIQERMRHALLRARRTQEPTALVFVDLDHFKRLNDTAGHSAGDEALVQVAEVIRSCIRPSDTAARLGGDEFAVLLEDADASHGAAVAKRIVGALRGLPIPQQRGRVVSASAGVSVAEAGAADSEALLRDADIAMYQAKASGRDRTAVFDPTMHEVLVRELAMESALRKALAEDELRIAYQPIFDLGTGRVAALEALVRWPDANGSSVPPSLFVPLAEEVGLIGELDRWVMARACGYVAELSRRCPELADVTLNVNVSAKDLDDAPAVERWVDEALDASGLCPRRLMLEITETAALPDLGTLAVPLQSLRERGIRVSLDDFGTGYSSLSSLKQLPLDEIKIDGSFVAGLPDLDNAARVVDGLVGMARSLGLPVVAEAVETEEQADVLRRIACDYAQGWLFAAPMPPDELESWVRERQLAATG